MDKAFEDLVNEFVEQFMSSHGGNYTKEDIINGFCDGLNNKPAPKGCYHAFLAWQAGKRNGGWS